MSKKEEIKEVYDKLTNENKQVIKMIANGMKIAQQNVKVEVKKQS